jgi:hypothetical protein
VCVAVGTHRLVQRAGFSTHETNASVDASVVLAVVAAAPRHSTVHTSSIRTSCASTIPAAPGGAAGGG